MRRSCGAGHQRWGEGSSGGPRSYHDTHQPLLLRLQAVLEVSAPVKHPQAHLTLQAIWLVCPGTNKRDRWLATLWTIFLRIWCNSSRGLQHLAEATLPHLESRLCMQV